MDSWEPQEVQQGPVQSAAPGSGQPQVSIHAGECREKDLGVQVGEKLCKTHQYALAAEKANCILSYIKAVWPAGQGR